ncbi:hypothetical protein Tco_0654784 [Tanacetum coccineum]|uniref:Uncharacterized protein n=1 Tax=Tanacetum coccineum TaxID=301880 RepID=A0ABQ4X492_9ASTR
MSVRLGNLPLIHLESEELELDRRELDKQEVEQPEVDRFNLDEPGIVLKGGKREVNLIAIGLYENRWRLDKFGRNEHHRK